ncbi:MAG: type II toxin-antitoxin system VapC family toxin [Spirochaetia bacterium]|uniref:type II toxin-antitoxin system VapC family toxin n=1 Tax=Treponema sp. TaxID=166 RepID=UPI00298D75B5|nr:type II toxin-antitoxin system VapC family toxin [uncultured Treponema sp.]MCI7397856.1 type II toxin-antitoxin system VapC family toxin [Spirochaetia bacterium]MCI7577758.1 type II toxin-antitoxin system VapC family toxin [Spirochaetia bacterium]
MNKIYLLDTNIVSEPTKKIRDENVLVQLESKSHLCAISSVTWAELIYGIEKLPAGKRRLNLQDYVINHINSLYEKIPFDEHASGIYGKIYYQYEKAGYVPKIHDLQIAATAMANNMILVTRNVKDFEPINGLMVENWFAS